MSTPVRTKLFDMEFDEVSLVERPANQHGLIAFSKSAEGGIPQEDQMTQYFDTDGDPVDVDVLEHGDVVFDETGEAYVYDASDDDDDDDDEPQGQYYAEDADQGQYAGVGKALPGLQRAALVTGLKGNAAQVGQHVKRNKWKYGAGLFGTGAAAGGAAALNKSAPPSFGDQVLYELSKAVNDDDRNQIIAKAMNEVEIVKAENRELSKALEAEQETRIEEAFIAKAADYNLPVHPAVLGPILKAMAEVLDPEQLDVVDQLFNSVGDFLYDEVGYVGDTDNDSVIQRVDALASELVGKSDLTLAEATTELFANNPAAYDAYLAENGR